MKIVKLSKVRSRRWQGSCGPDGKRPSVYLGKCSEVESRQCIGHLTRLHSAQRVGQQPHAAELGWLASIDIELHKRISRTGLCKPRSSNEPPGETLGRFIAAYIERRSDVGDRCRLNLRQTEAKLVKHFGSDQLIALITVGDAKAFRQVLEGQGFALATISMHVKKARQFFNDAVDRGILEENPFKKVRAGSQVNAEKMKYILDDTVRKVMAVADDDMRLVLALARFAGLRCPSELVHLRFADISLDRLHVTSPKTRKQAKGHREPRLNRDLVDLLKGAAARATPGQLLIFPDRKVTQNMRTQIGRLCIRAGVEPWPKLLQNLRLSCETDWIGSHGLSVACKWSGNTADVALKHYHLVREEDYLATGAEHGAEWRGIVGNREIPAQKITPAEAGNSAKIASIPFNASAGVINLVPPRGVEPLFTG